jgi:hypothetical protein
MLERECERLSSALLGVFITGEIYRGEITAKESPELFLPAAGTVTGSTRV